MTTVQSLLDEKSAFNKLICHDSITKTLYNKMMDLNIELVNRIQMLESKIEGKPVMDMELLCSNEIEVDYKL